MDLIVFFFLMIRRPPRSTLDRSSAASDVYKRQSLNNELHIILNNEPKKYEFPFEGNFKMNPFSIQEKFYNYHSVSYTHLRAHETVLDIVCRLLLEKKTKHKKKKKKKTKKYKKNISNKKNEHDNQHRHVPKLPTS